jgi:hypothetical protein
MKTFLESLVENLFIYLLFIMFSPIIMLLAIYQRLIYKIPKKPRLMFGPNPLISNKHWANSLKKIHYTSETVMQTVMKINKKTDFDFVYGAHSLYRFVSRYIIDFSIFLYCLCKYDIFHFTFNGGIWQHYWLWRLEIIIYKLAGKKIICMPYGGDAYQYSKVYDFSVRHGLLTNYPQYSRLEQVVHKKIHFLSKYSDFVITGIMLDAFPRWDMSPVCSFVIDTEDWTSKTKYSDNDGSQYNKPVRVIHTPNHRGYKGTEFIIQSIEDLKKEGLFIDLILIENKTNEDVKKIMPEADILIEQIIAPGYAFSGIEGMANGLVVMSNLTDPMFVTFLKRYSYLEECKIIPTNPENIKEELKKLIINPEMRKKNGELNRKYVEKYHSYRTSQIMFQRIYEKIWFKNSKLILTNYFHPLIGQYDQDYNESMNEH